MISNRLVCLLIFALATQSASAAPAKSSKPPVKTVKRVKNANGFVPPPPPITPSFIDPAGLSLYYGSAMPLEFLSKENLKDKEKEIGMQLSDAERELNNKKRSIDERRARAVDFEQLFKEGVISRRELETAQNEAADSGFEIARLETKVSELRGYHERISKRLQALNPQSKNQKRKIIH